MHTLVPRNGNGNRNLNDMNIAFPPPPPKDSDPTTTSRSTPQPYCRAVTVTVTSWVAWGSELPSIHPYHQPSTRWPKSNISLSVFEAIHQPTVEGIVALCCGDGWILVGGDEGDGLEELDGCAGLKMRSGWWG